MSTQFHRPADDDVASREREAGSPSETTRAFGLERDAEPAEPSPSSGPVATTPIVTDEAAPPRRRHVIDRFDAAAGLLVLRLATAAVVGVHGLQKIAELSATEQLLTQVGVPAPHIMALIFGPLEIAVAVALVLGIAVRAAGLGVAVIAVCALVLVKWTDHAALFVANQPGFTGDTEFLLAGVGLALLGVGGGGWGLDRKVRNRGKV